MLIVLQHGYGYVCPSACMRVDRSVSGILHLQFVVPEMFLDRTLQLPDGEHALHQARCSDRVPTRDQPTGWINGANRFVFKFYTVIDARQECFARFSERPTFAVTAQAEILIRLDLARSVGVMQFDKIELLKWVLDPGVLPGHVSCGSTGTEGMHTWIAGAVIP